MSALEIRSRLAPAAIATVLALITFAVFAQTAGFSFLNFDDDLFISENPRLKDGLSARGLAWAFTANLTHDDPYAEYWQPLTGITRLADVQFFGLDAGAHHRTNLVLHLAAGLVLFGALRVLLRSDLRSGLIAALFLIHPLHVEAVAWLSARKDILNGLFFFGTLWAYARYSARPGWGRYLWVWFIFVCANLAKPMAVSLPFVLLLLDFWPLGRLRLPFFDRATGRLILEKVPLILMAALVALLAFIDQHKHGALGDDVLYPLSARLGSVAIGYGAYLVQTFVPLNFAVLYPHPGTDLNWPLAAASAACLLLITGFCIATAKRRPWLFVGWFWFVGVLLPVSGIVQIGEMARADRYTYVSLVGIFLLCVQEASQWLASPRIRDSRRAALRRGAVAVSALAIAALAVVAWRQTGTWVDSISVFRHAIAVTEGNYIAETNLGSALFEAGKKEEGRAHYRRAIRLDAAALAHHRQAAIEAEQRHDLPTAIQHYAKFLTVVPGDAEVRLRLGGVLLENGDYAKALLQYNEALRYEQNAVPPRLGVARVLIAQKRFAEARGLLGAILKLDADNEEAAALLQGLPAAN